MMTTSFKQEYKQEYKQEPSEISPGYQHGCNDDYNFDTYFNFEPNDVATPSISPLSHRSKSVSTPTLISANPVSATVIPGQSNPLFAPPSHQYGQYRQHAGFAPGAMQNTFAVNQADQYGYTGSNYGTIPPTDGYSAEMNISGDCPHFNTLASQNSSDVDMGFGAPASMNTLNSSYVDPAAIGGPNTTPRTEPAQVHPARVYPGHHQQQALAKAQAEAQRQAASHSRPSSRSASSGKPSEPLVDASISRLLNHMRHTSVASSHDDDDDDAATPNANGQSHRTRKDEEDMDEDERLLASEEGKKLSSKERRQLRNKVSARAFRSRRKEYIGQLEGEIGAKDKECEDLRKKNESLQAENIRLTDLTHMLLGSPHFQPFLDELSRNPEVASLSTPFQGPRSQASEPPSQSSNRPQDISPNQVNRQSQVPRNTQVGLTMIPEEPTFDYTSNLLINTGYTNNMNFGGLYDPQVCAVTSVPQGPAVDTPNFGGILSGKSSNFVGPCPLPDDDKDEQPFVDAMPVATANSSMLDLIESPTEDVTIDVSDAALALFSGTASPSSQSSPIDAPEECIFGDIELDKAFGRIELQPTDTPTDAAYHTTEISLAVLERFERLCARCDALSTRVATRTSHP